MSHSKDTSAPQESAKGSQRFRELWKMQSRFQQGMLCTAAVSMGGTWLASSSLDSNLVFMELMTGNVVGVIKFESRFHVTAMTWGSDSILYAGCSNGTVLIINYVPTDRRPIFMRSILQPFKSPVSTIALDNIGNQLAVGCGGDAFIFTRPVFGSVESWELIDHISAPSEGHHSLITAMAYSGSMPEQRHLFIGHAKAGYCVWRSPRDYHRTPYVKGGPVCSIGSATMATDGSFIVIVTLDHSTVVYPMAHDGPKLNEGRVYTNQELTGYRPIVPVTLAANRMVLKGSTSGQVPVMDLLNGPLAPIENGSNDVVRVLTGYGDKIIVGLSDTSGCSSQFICYLDIAVSISDFVHSDDNHPVFEVTISELEEAGCFNTVDNQEVITTRWPSGKQSEVRSRSENTSEKGVPEVRNAMSALPFSSLLLPLVTALSAFLRHRRTWTTIAILWGFITILVVDPPNLPVTQIKKSTSPSGEYSNQKPSEFVSSTDLIYTKADTATGLGVLLWFLGSFVATRLIWWGTWCITCCLLFLSIAFKGIVYVAFVFPRLIRYIMTNLPVFLYNTICDALNGYDVPVCPARA